MSAGLKNNSNINMLKKIPKSIWLLLVIVLIGVFLRAYNFSDWLRVNMDQARDTSFVESLIKENTWPALGPKAGGTEFRLGPAFYYFQIISARIFGASFPAVAYPDLFFSLLSIPLLFLLARIYFNKPISLTLAWLFAISYFVIKYSRFAWNPNSAPFFVMLFIYAVYRINGAEKNKKNWWGALAGIALGIGAQLHTTLLVLLPISALLFAFYLYKNKTLTSACAIAVLTGALLVNIFQINTEIRTGGSNIHAFFEGVANKGSRNASFIDNIALNITCHIRANYGILTSYSDKDECDYNAIARDVVKLDSKKIPLADKILFVSYLIIATIFSLGGYCIAFCGLRKETNKDKKFFLTLVLSYVFLTFLFFTLWANELLMRFFLILEFVPFFLLGFWLKFLSEKFKKQRLLAIIILVLSFFCLRKDYLVFKDLQFGGREINGNFEYITLGEVDFITDYIKRNNDGDKTAYVDAQAGYLFKAFKSLRLVASKKGLELVELNKAVSLTSGDRLFYLRNSSDGCELPDNIAKKYVLEKCALYRQFSVFDLKVK